MRGVPWEGKAQRSPAVQIMLQSLVAWSGFVSSLGDLPAEGTDPS